MGSNWGSTQKFSCSRTTWAWRPRLEKVSQEPQRNQHLEDFYINEEGIKTHKRFITCQQHSATTTESLRGVWGYLNKVMNNYSLLEKLLYSQDKSWVLLLVSAHYADLFT